MSTGLDDRLRGMTFGIQDDDVMLILDAHLIRAPGGPAVMTKAAVSVMEGSEFKKTTKCLTDSKLAMRLVEL